MSHNSLLLIAAAGVALLLLLIIKVKVQPFVALMVVSIGVALAAGVPAADLVSTIEDGMGSTLGHIATIIALGAMIGRIVELSGGAASLAHSLIARFGEKRTPLALTVAGFLLGIPVFFEVGLIILMPIAYGVARASRKPLLIYALPMAAAMLTVHAFLPPHPGAVAAAATIGADQGWVLLLGIPLTAVVIFAGHLLAKRMTRREYTLTADVYEKVYGDGGGEPGESPEPIATGGDSDSDGSVPAGPGAQQVGGTANPPSFGMVVSLIITPIALILLGTIGTNTLAEGSVTRAVLTVLGAPMVALLIAAGLAAYFLGVRRGWSSGQISSVMGSALPGVAMVILVAGAGGVFGKVLVQTGIGDAVADILDRTGLPLLALAFVMTLLLRAVQGSATVALVATAGLITPLLHRTDLSAQQLALVCLAMGAGALAVSHINDAGYWMFTKLAGLEVGDGLRTWTVLTTAMGVIGFALTGLLWLVV
ncbi:GntP family transporter [Streptomyces sp. NPDC088400]|uniref:GntP family transporter n=1 Tax=Streptomyces sp. NPDC088400 TaxID=3365861 RepID=UPI0038004BBC